MMMKAKQYMGLMMMAAGMLTTASCSDFDDYNTAPVDATASANQTLWQNIAQNSELSDFAALVEKAGFAPALQSSHYYTVWAPKNGTYDAAALMQKGNETILREFVKNHIADYSHAVSGEKGERIHMLNAKSYDFVGSGSYTFGEVPVAQTNLPSTNGILHTLDGMAVFYPNLYEYLDVAENIDSLRNYIKAYETSVLDVAKSVVGPTVNGKQTYIDSVMITDNSMTRSMRAYIEREDSSYTMMLPTNEAWVAAYNRIKPYFNYIATTKAQDIKSATSATAAPELSVTVDAAYMADSLAKRFIASNLVFNNNLAYNRWVENPQEVRTDTIFTTGNTFLANPDEYLASTVNKVRMSNGFARIVDSLAVRPWDGWAGSITQMALGSSNRVWNGTPQNRKMLIITAQGDTTVYYLHAQPSSNYAKPQVDVMLDRVMSTTYNIYAVLMPPYDDAVAMETPKPNQLDFSLSYCNAKGALAIQKLNQKVENNPNRIDTVFVGKFTFPVCYAFLPDRNIRPNLKITTGFNVFNKKAMETYTRDIRIAGIIMKPAELDEFEANN